MGPAPAFTRIRWWLPLCLSLASAAAALPACSGSSAGMTTADADFVSCAAETRATPYLAGMQVTSRTGTFVIKLLSNTFTDANNKVLTEAPAKGVNVWTIEADAAGTQSPVDGLTIGVSPYMPDHLHGTTPVAVTPAGAGTYRASMDLYMAGYWEITVTITDSSSGTSVVDSAMLPICVPG